MNEIAAKIEALLFAAGRPVSREELESILDIGTDEVDAGLLLLEEVLKEGALELKVIANEAQLRLRESYLPLAEAVAKPAMDKNVLKTAALIGYYQPILQSDLVTMVGSSAYSHVALLKEMDLIISEREGRSFMLRTTPGFAQYFGIDATDAEDIKRYLAKKLGL